MKFSSLTRCIALSILILSLSVPLSAQSGRGTIAGVVKDPQASIVPGVDITITNQDTGDVTKALTTDSGVYRVPYLPPGRYRVTASQPGFKTALRENIDVLVAQTVTVDFNLEVGEVSQTVTVSSEAPLLEKDTSEIGINSTEKEVHTWPIIVGDGTRQLQSFIFNSMPGTQGGEFLGTINGGQAYSHEILIDGISIGRFDLNGGSNNEFTPTMDAVSEFKLQTGALAAQYGNTQTALVNFGLKGGSNAFHGGAFWFHKQPAFNANSWNNNRFNRKKTGARENNAGFTFGGPILKDRTHFFWSYEGERLTDQTVTGTQSMPIGAFKKGDFSLLLDPNFTKDPRSGTIIGKDALGRDVRFGQIYDPFSARQLPDGTWVRDPFVGNVIPQGRFSAVTRNVLKYDVPDPPLLQFRNNTPRIGTCCPFLDIDNYSLKLDHVLSQDHKTAGSFVYNKRIRRRFGGGTPQLTGPIPGPFMAGDKTQNTPGWIIRFAEDWTLSPAKLNHFAYGYNRFRNANQSNSLLSGIDWVSTLGLQNVGKNTFPVIRLRGFNTVQTGGYPNFGHGGTGNAPNGSNIIEDDFTWIRGAHSFRFGGEHRRYYLNERTVQNAGDYTFHSENTDMPGFSTQTGFAYASFLLGAVRSAGLGVPLLTPGTRSRTTAFYVQDDWKVTPNLTLNFGLRWDIPTPLTEVLHRMSGLNPTKPNPGANGFPGAFEMLGNCSGCSGRDSFTDTYWKEFGPRIGFAWGPGTNPNFVIRGGYGINYAPPLQDGFNFPYFVGFDGSNPINQRTGRFRDDPSYLWDNPYPLFTKKLPNPDPTLLNNDSIGYYRPDTNKYPKVHNWNFGIQFGLPWQTRMEVNYIGNKASRLKDIYLYNLNQVDPKWLSLGDALLDDIDDHPEIKKPYASFSGSVGQSKRPFPQYQDISTHRLNDGYSNYHSMQMTFIKRSNYGLSFLAAYTFSKALGNADSAIGYGTYAGGYGQNFYNRKADYSVTAFNFPNALKLTWIYDLPWGPGGRWLKGGLAGSVLGGWTVSAIHRYQSGVPLGIAAGGFDGSALFNPGLYADTLLPRDQQILGKKPSTIDTANGTPYLNPKAFGNPPLTAAGVPKRLGNAPRLQPNLRGFAQHSEDMSLIKRSALGFREGANLEFRMDAINILNRITVCDPATDASDPSSFGRIYGKCGGPRNIQLGLRVTF